jgi:hypothetical protein
MFKQPLPKKTPKYVCKLCDFSTCNKKDYVKHLQTIKHNSAKTPGFLNKTLNQPSQNRKTRVFNQKTLKKTKSIVCTEDDHNACNKNTTSSHICAIRQSPPNEPVETQESPNTTSDIVTQVRDACKKLESLCSYIEKTQPANISSTAGILVTNVTDCLQQLAPLCSLTVTAGPQIPQTIAWSSEQQPDTFNAQNDTSCVTILANNDSPLKTNGSNEEKGKQYKCVCGKGYSGRSGLWHHKKVCAVLNAAKPAEHTACETNHPDGIRTDVMDAFLSLIKQNNEFKELMMEQCKQIQDFQKQLCDVTKPSNIIHNTTNNSFNLNVFLNETCKDALNMMDFINSLHLQLSDLEETGKLGYSNGMSRIFIKGLKDMEVHKRPIHCSDLKREILYIKEDNVWEKDNEEKDKIKQAIRRVQQKNIQQIPLWIKEHPNCTISSNRDNTPYLNMVIQSTGGANPNDDININKIIANIAKETVIVK